MKKLLHKTNVYFFGVEHITLHDYLWFYGGLACMTGVPAMVFIHVI